MSSYPDEALQAWADLFEDVALLTWEELHSRKSFGAWLVDKHPDLLEDFAQFWQDNSRPGPRQNWRWNGAWWEEA